MTTIDTNPGASWDLGGSPEDAGWSAEGTNRLQEVISRQSSDCVVVVQGGRIVFTHGDISHKFLCHSMRKSFLAAMLGEDVASGRIDLSATMEDLGIDDLKPLSQTERQATILDLLMARSGIYHPAGYETEWMQRIKEKRGSHAPGTFWCYNNWDFNALGSIFTQLTGESVAEAFQKRLATPLEMEDFSLSGETPDGWVEQFEVSRHPAYPFRLSSRDLARFGQLFLQNGRWSGKMILPDGWAEENVMPYSYAGPHGAYGYCWWLERDGVFVSGVRTPPGSYAAQGAGGHYCMIIPALDMVLVHRVDTDQEGRAVNQIEFGALLKALFSAAQG
ncbi:serine hydrolase [Nitratireductor aquimarinus]|uniref:serine hydrolase domain-containing protein n=1 Tax=Nitratireductor TaxID=245876 RepID=UPI000DDDCF40|nr:MULTISPECIES: serine hydrolase [Nitratireductor]MBN7776556.1 serine hydrolase [Nitratireductor pacificus]MBN7779423.1 serine hydrolase [Nitratireductor pacificus]MBN7788230.1 serine hydrolase [Nitratireductor aquimarinus]MBY6098277.1 beta-lactamase family protein [Nitratireductor aquimarinus]MCA1259256.1 beta-lactamase family protein [Nitratireductor aquimarinus]